MILFQKTSLRCNFIMLKTLLMTGFIGIIFPTKVVSQPYSVQSDQWFATDALGRSSVEFNEAGNTRKGKYVGIFYLTWHHEFAKREKFSNVSKILRKFPEAANDENHPAWENFFGDYFWDEPLFGYYSTTDEWVLRKHAELLADAGVDVVFLDCTNGSFTWKESYMKLCEVWTKARQDGVKTPSIAFILPFGALSNARISMTEIYQDLYAPGLYKDLWFMWKGKPLMLAYPESLDQPISDSNVTAGMKFTATTGFNGVDVNCPSWGNNIGSLTLSLYQWNTDYATSVAGTPIASKTFDNFYDNAWLLLPTSDLAPGDYVWELSQAQEIVGVWKYPDAIGTATSFVNGIPVTGQFNARIRTTSNSTMIPLTTGSTITPVQLFSKVPTADTEEIKQFFTFRPPVGSLKYSPNRTDQWGWLNVYPQHGFAPTENGFEEVTVGIAQNASDETGGHCTAFNMPGTYGRSYTNAYGQSADTSAYLYNLNFDEQWSRAYELDPELVFVDGWNEWVAWRHQGWTDCVGRVITHHAFPDAYNWDKSRDIEPVKGWGKYADVSYLHFVNKVRKFKGMTQPAVASTEKEITIGSFSGWNDVLPEYPHYKGNTLHRSHDGYGSLFYTNTTGRNDIVMAKVARDAQNLYFYVETSDTLTHPTETDWMQLFIDIDRNKSTGWEGYDFMLNRTSPTQTMTLERSIDSWNWTSVGQVNYAIDSNKIEIEIPRTMLGEHASDTLDFEFKWADNAQLDGNILNFYTNGDAAPGGRFNFRYCSHVIPDPVICKPYRIDALRIPNTLQAQEFDKGGQQFTFYDKTAENTSGAFRSDEAVDIAPTGDSKGQFDVVNIEDGEWMDYSIHSTKKQLYFLEIRYAATTASILHFEVNGEDVSSSLSLESTGSESSYKTYLTAFELPQGIYPLRIVFDQASSGLRVNYFNFLGQDPACCNRTEWNFNYSSDCWATNSAVSGKAQNGIYTLEISNSAPDITSFGALQIPGKVFKWVKIRLKNNSNATRAKFHWMAYNETEWNPSRMVEFELSSNNADYVDYYLNPDKNSLWRTTLKQLKLEFPDASKGSIDIDQIRLSTVNTSGTNKINSPVVTVSPNPARDKFIINSGLTTIEKIQIFDMQGRLVFSDKISFEGSKQISPSLKKGMYLIHLKTVSDNIIKRLIIQ